MEERWAQREKGWREDVIETVGLFASVEKEELTDKKGKKESDISSNSEDDDDFLSEILNIRPLPYAEVQSQLTVDVRGGGDQTPSTSGTMPTGTVPVPNTLLPPETITITTVPQVVVQEKPKEIDVAKLNI